MAAGLVATGGVATLLSGALLTLMMGCGFGATLVMLHAAFRSPNLKARLSQAKSRLDGMGGIARDYGL